MAAAQPLILMRNYNGSSGAYNAPLGVQGDLIALGGQSSQLRQVPYELVCVLTDTVLGTVATVNFQTSPDGSTWTTQFSLAYSLATKLAQGHKRVGALPTPFCQLTVSGLSGQTAPLFNAYFRLKQ